MKLETLYKLDSKGKLQEWSIEVTDEGGSALLVTRHGKVGGKIQEAAETITAGKNIGRANETTPLQQAEAEARSEWEKQVSRKGYTPDQMKALSGANDQAGTLSPMLAHKYTERAKYICWPAYCQPKLDGQRVVAVYDGSETTLWSREQKPIVGLPHIAAAITAQMKKLGITTEVVFDGEAYHHDYRARFGEIISFVKKLKPGHEVVQYHIYDLPRSPDNDSPPAQGSRGFSRRYLSLECLLRDAPDCLQLVETVPVEDEAEATDAFKHFVSLGYEGAMLRNSASPYAEGKRSNDLQKMKEFDDAEFEIIGVKEGRGKFAGLAVYSCRAANGKTFDCNPPGPLTERNISQCSLDIGKQLTVQYFGLTDAEEVPRFPVGKAIRE